MEYVTSSAKWGLDQYFKALVR
uniref:Uncharacterized protein n=1 Tax=Rhizophora mucronata TaxID=61149 RepID=A0A2P2QNZ2_RHIMU